MGHQHSSAFAQILLDIYKRNIDCSVIPAVVFCVFE